jgi:hypothetical protein
MKIGRDIKTRRMRGGREEDEDDYELSSDS